MQDATEKNKIKWNWENKYVNILAKFWINNLDFLWVQKYDMISVTFNKTYEVYQLWYFLRLNIFSNNPVFKCNLKLLHLWTVQ